MPAGDQHVLDSFVHFRTYNTAFEGSNSSPVAQVMMFEIDRRFHDRCAASGSARAVAPTKARMVVVCCYQTWMAGVSSSCCHQPRRVVVSL